jgi:hypothetical protein
LLEAARAHELLERGGHAGKVVRCYAEYVCVPEGGALVGMPADVTYEDAAALVEGMLTVLPFLRDTGHVQAGGSEDVSTAPQCRPTLLVFTSPALDPPEDATSNRGATRFGAAARPAQALSRTDHRSQSARSREHTKQPAICKSWEGG